MKGFSKNEIVWYGLVLPALFVMFIGFCEWMSK